MKLTATQENQLRIQFSQMVRIQYGPVDPIKDKVDLMVDELKTLLPQDNPTPQQIAEAKEIVLYHHLAE